MTNEQYKLLVKIANGEVEEGKVDVNGIVIDAAADNGKDLAKVALSIIDDYNLMGAKKANMNQYGQGNDCAMPKGCWKEGTYLDGIYQQFSDAYSAGWPAVQPTFKLDMSANNWNGQETDVSAMLSNPNYPATASGYNQATAVMPAVSAWPAYVSAGRGQTKDQEGYVSGQNVLIAQGTPVNDTQASILG